METKIYRSWFIHWRTDILWIRIVTKSFHCTTLRTEKLNPLERQISKKEMRSIRQKHANFFEENYSDSFNIKTCKSFPSKWQLSRDCEIFQLFELHCCYFYNISNVCRNYACLWLSKARFSFWCVHPGFVRFYRLVYRQFGSYYQHHLENLHKFLFRKIRVICKFNIFVWNNCFNNC